jgi:hypothetical protein
VKDILDARHCGIPLSEIDCVDARPPAYSGLTSDLQPYQEPDLYQDTPI